jgi:hypothetical protein
MNIGCAAFFPVTFVLAMSGCTPVKVKLGWKVYLDKTPTSGQNGRDGADGRNGFDGPPGKGGGITVTYDPQVKPFLSVIRLSNKGGLPPVFKQEPVPPLW